MVDFAKMLGMKVAFVVSHRCEDETDAGAALLASGFKIKELVVNGMHPADEWGTHWANLNKVKWRRFMAQWGLYGDQAGAIRNKEILEYADALVAVYDGANEGVFNMIKQAQAKGIPVYVYETDHGL